MAAQIRAGWSTRFASYADSTADYDSGAVYRVTVAGRVGSETHAPSTGTPVSLGSTSAGYACDRLTDWRSTNAKRAGDGVHRVAPVWRRASGAGARHGLSGCPRKPG